MEVAREAKTRGALLFWLTQQPAGQEHCPSTLGSTFNHETAPTCATNRELRYPPNASRMSLFAAQIYPGQSLGFLGNLSLSPTSRRASLTGASSSRSLPPRHPHAPKSRTAAIPKTRSGLRTHLSGQGTGGAQPSHKWPPFAI